MEAHTTLRQRQKYMPLLGNEKILMIRFELITDIHEAEALWDYISPKQELYDLWNFRFSYWEFEKPEVLFVAGYDDDNLIGLLPLQWSKDGYYEFFGGSFMSYNQLFIKKEYLDTQIEFLSQVNKPMWLRWMASPVDHPNLTTSDPSTYFLTLIGLTSLDDYFEKFVGKTRGKQLKKEVRNVLKQNTELIIDNTSDISSLVEFNKKRFGETSVFHNSNRQAFFEKIVSLFPSYILTVKIDNEIAAVGLRIIHKNILYGINTGVKEGTKNLGKFLYLKAIEFAIENKLEKYDALEGAYGWKEEFGFEGRPQYHLDLRDK